MLNMRLVAIRIGRTMLYVSSFPIRGGNDIMVLTHGPVYDWKETGRVNRVVDVHSRSFKPQEVL